MSCKNCHDAPTDIIFLLFCVMMSTVSYVWIAWISLGIALTLPVHWVKDTLTPDATSAMSDAALNRNWDFTFRCRRLALTPGWWGVEPGLEPCIAVTLPVRLGIFRHRRLPQSGVMRCWTGTGILYWVVCRKALPHDIWISLDSTAKYIVGFAHFPFSCYFMP